MIQLLCVKVSSTDLALVHSNHIDCRKAQRELHICVGAGPPQDMKMLYLLYPLSCILPMKLSKCSSRWKTPTSCEFDTLNL